MNEIIPIFYACDKGFVKYTAVSLSSMIKHSSAERKYRIHVLHTDIDDETKELLYRLSGDNFEVSFDDVTEYLKDLGDRLPLRHYYTKTTYFRLFIPDMFPQYDKAIYIDSDTVLRADIAKLYDLELSDNLVGACPEQVMAQMDIYGEYCESVVGVSRDRFFNAGLLLMNCRLMREGDLLGRFSRLMGEYEFTVTQDEDYLNVLCKDRVRYLDTRWNTEVAGELKYPYPDGEAFMLHYIMVNKPWHYENCRAAEYFFEAARGASMYSEMLAEARGYTDAQRERDRRSAENLAEMARGEILREDNYRRVCERKKDPERVRVTRLIEQYEREGRFDTDVENDPPSRTLMPDEIDYERRGALAKIKTFFSAVAARVFLNKILRKRLLIVKEVKGRENLSALKGGAVVTCNHFNPFDSFAMHVAYERSGQKKRLYRVIREGNYTSFPGFYGFLMRNFYTLPLSSNLKTMIKFNRAADKLLLEGAHVLFYPEQSMWWNYRKPKPLKPGAYRFAVKNRVPVLPCFITMRDSEAQGADGYPIQEYTVHICKPIYPNEALCYKDAIADLMEKNKRTWEAVYEQEYGIKVTYNTEKTKEQNALRA